MLTTSKVSSTGNAYYLLGRTYQKAGMTKEAENVYREFLSKFPKGKQVERVKSIVAGENVLTRDQKNTRSESRRALFISIIITIVLLGTAGTLGYRYYMIPSLMNKILGIEKKNVEHTEKLFDAESSSKQPFDKDDAGALLYAAENGHTDVLKTLLASGVDVNAKTESGWTGLHAAAQSGNCNILEILLAAGADVNSRNIFGFTPLYLAAAGGHRSG